MDLGSIPATIRHTITEGVGNDGMFTYSADLQAQGPCTSPPLDEIQTRPESSQLHSARGGQAQKLRQLSK